MTACSPAASRPMVVVRPVSHPADEQFLAQRPWKDDSHRWEGQWPEAQTRMSRCRIALRPCSTAISRGRLVGPPTVSRRASDAPKDQGALESGPETVKTWTRLTDQRGLLDARAICFQTSPPPSGADSASVGRSPEAQFRHVHASAASHPVDVDPAPPASTNHRLAEQLSMKSPHHHWPLIVQCVPVWQWVASWGKRRTLRGTTSLGNSSDPELAGGAVAAGLPTPYRSHVQ